jgi:4-amino-4-deoxy-L-arabinose transferase-like glycosyltransferase
MVLIVGPTSFPANIDSIQHHQIAQNLVQGNGYTMDGQPTAYRAPFLTFAMAACYLIFGQNFLFVRLVIIGLSLVLIWTIYYLGKEIFHPAVGLWAALITAVYPHFIFYSARILTETPFTLFSLLAVILFIKFFKTEKNLFLLMSGFFLGLGILTRPVGFFLLGLMFLFMFWKFPFRVNLKKISILAAITFLIISPWTTRNYLVFKKFIPVTTQGALVLWVSNNHYVAHHPYYGGINSLYQHLPGAAQLITKDEIVRSEYSSRYFMQFIKEYPRDIPRLVWNKAYRFWSPAFFTGSSRAWMYKNFYLAILTFSIMGVILVFRSPNVKISYLWIILLANFLPALVFWAGPRIRMPAEPVLIILSALTIEQFRSWMWKKWHRES